MTTADVSFSLIGRFVLRRYSANNNIHKIVVALTLSPPSQQTRRQILQYKIIIVIIESRHHRCSNAIYTHTRRCASQFLVFLLILNA